MSFKLLAIRPLDGCNPKFLKNLKENEFYTFYNDYVFEKSINPNEIKIKYKSTLPEDLYWDKVKSQINISAIVGKNGSGKSSVLELFYVTIYNLSVQKRIIKEENKEENIEFDFEELDSIVKSSNIDDINNNIRIFSEYKYYLENQNKITEVIETEKKINVQVFFTLRGEVYVIHLNDNTSKVIKFQEKQEQEIDFKEYKCNINEFSLDEFSSLKQNRGLFYSVVNNYSLYGLNSIEIGDWITKIFHKNDSYQTPIVINPMRTDGIIDVNKETDLSKSRLLSNVLSYVKEDEKIEDSLRCLVKNKVVKNLILKLKFDKFKNKKGEIDFEYLVKYKNNYLLNILNAFKVHNDVKDITQNEFDEKYNSEKLSNVEKFAIEYILRKIEKIANIYEIEKKKYVSSKSKFSYENRIVTIDFLNILKDQESHITFKLRQAINFLTFDYKSLSKFKEFNDETIVSIKDLSKEISENLEALKTKYLKPMKDSDNKDWYYIPSNFKLINFIPPSFFEIDMDFENNMGKFNFLSSGEKQKIFSISSVLYHIININSNHSGLSDDDANLKYEYKFVNIMFDEIELCFHPEMQKTFINDLLKMLQKIGHNNIYMNIIFVTHSPFILSDIPSQNIMFLKTEKEVDDIGKERFVSGQVNNVRKTFGANIHDLLADSFFIGDGFIGDFAKKKINEVIKFLKKKESDIKTKEEAKQIIEIIDEPLVKHKLKEMYLENITDNDYIDEEIERLNKLKERK